jgi:hypothetical protein
MGVMSHSRDIDAVLRERFEFRGFRPGQRELIARWRSPIATPRYPPNRRWQVAHLSAPGHLLDCLSRIVSPLIARGRGAGQVARRRRSRRGRRRSDK